MADAHDESAALDTAALEVLLAGSRLGHPLIYLPAVESTSTEAMRLAREGAPDGLLVTTDDQTRGRGRMGRVWHALPGELLALSLVLRPNFPPHVLIMAVALSVAAGIERATGLRPGIKWPNDVLIGGRKVCGILIEASGDVTVVGIGINVTGSLAEHPELAARATTLAEQVGRPIAREAVAAAVIRALDREYRQLRDGGEAARVAVRATWLERLVTIGQRVSIQQGERTITGIAEGVDDDGALLVRQDDGRAHTILWGDVEAIGG